MSNQLSFPWDQAAAVPIALTDGIINFTGAVAGAAAASSAPALLAASISSDNTQLVMVPVGQTTGSATVTVTAPGVAAYTMTVTITAPVATEVTANVAAAVLEPYVPASSTTTPATPTAS